MSTLPERLKNLPDFDPPAGGWADLQRRMDARPSRARRSAYAGGFALAASLALAVGVRLNAPTAVTPEPVTVQGPQEIAVLMQESRDLEKRLTTLKPQVAVWSSDLAARSAGLEGDLAMVDLQLNYAEGPDGARRLWQNRVQLMSQLVHTHRAAALQPMMYASLEQTL